ncbi:DNA alkylation repair protein [Patescibacteria group bacterium]|jgi:3-methyladenine DNA glycosylase AlkD|nr:DNA alkylation repair protein [Patescibacteria group bacterium]
MTCTAAAARQALRAYAEPDRIPDHQRSFKTGKGEYGEGDRFIGVRAPNTRSVAKRFKELPLPEVTKLLTSKVHEERLLALAICELQMRATWKFNFQVGVRTDKARKDIVDLYLAHAAFVNNWDLVDASAYQILGAYLLMRPKRERSVLTRLARSGHLWEERIAIVATMAFIREGQLDETFRIAKILQHHEHDLIHKAVGWLIREAGTRDEPRLHAFLQEQTKGVPRYQTLPRTCLRYAIERFPEGERKRYLQGDV